MTVACFVLQSGILVGTGNLLFFEFLTTVIFLCKLDSKEPLAFGGSQKDPFLPTEGWLGLLEFPVLRLEFTWGKLSIFNFAKVLGHCHLTQAKATSRDPALQVHLRVQS